MTHNPPEIIKLLAHNLRWQMTQALAIGDYRVTDLVNLIDQPLNLVSYHLKQMREGDLVTARRSEADGRDTYYSLDLDHLRELYQQAGRSIHPAMTASDVQKQMLGTKPRVLFLCTHNSARSQMAEGLTRHLSGGAIPVYSAGSHPTRLHPEAISTMDVLGIDIRQQKVTHINELLDQEFDVVITVCDRARENCPTFTSGEVRQIHWGFPDPTRIKDSAERKQAFTETARRLQSRIQYFLGDTT